MNDSRFEELLAKWQPRGVGLPKNRQWSKIALHLGVSQEEAREFGQRLLEIEAKPKTPIEPETPPNEAQYTHDDAYWYDPARDLYVIWLPHLPKPMAMPGHIWASIKAAYSQWQGNPASVEQIARKFALTRRTVTALLRIMAHTHTGSPWTREHVAATEDKSLVEDLILAREERVLRQAEAQHWDRIKAKAESWDKLQKGCLDALNDWLTATPRKRSVPPSPQKGPAKPFLAVFGLTDLHYGSLGHDAAAALQVALEGALKRLSLRGIPTQIVLPIGSDGLHFDTAGYTTTAGTRMEVSGTARDTVVGYMELVAKLVEDLSAVSSVHCLPMAGNHDRMMSFATFAAMKLAFKNNPRVTFSKSLSDIQVLTFGKSLISFHHGDRHKPEALASILPRDSGPLWGATEYHYCLMGHYHTQGTFGSKSGLECIYMPSLAPTDEWSEGQGFKSQPSMSLYLFDQEDGLVSIDTVRGPRL